MDSFWLISLGELYTNIDPNMSFDMILDFSD